MNLSIIKLLFNLSYLHQIHFKTYNGFYSLSKLKKKYHSWPYSHKEYSIKRIINLYLRRHLRQQQLKKCVNQEHNGRGPIASNREEHHTEPGPNEDHLYTELHTEQAGISRETGQFASTSDNQYTELHTINRQLETPHLP